MSSSLVLRHAALLACGLLLGCSDNATRLSFAIERLAAPADPTSGPRTQEILYTPRSHPDTPYFLVFFPDHPVDPHQLEIAGLPPAWVRRLYTEMAHLAVGRTPYLVFMQPGSPIHFTTHWRGYASVPEVLVIPGQGAVAIRLDSNGGATTVSRPKG